MSIRVDGREYNNVSDEYDRANGYVCLVTYTVDGEPGAPLYTLLFEAYNGGQSVREYLADAEVGVVENIDFWVKYKA